MRNTFRNGLILLSLFLAIFAPFVASGYSEMNKAAAASSYREAAEHYRAAAVRIPWRADLYELAGDNFYLAKEYAKADAAYEMGFKRNVLSPQGWVAWGDAVYMNGDRERAIHIWEQGLAQPVMFGMLYSRLAQIYQQDGEYSKAVQYLQLYVTDHWDDASAHYRLGLLMTLSNPDEAVTELLNASQLAPEFDPAVQTLRTAVNLSSLSDSPSARPVIIGRGLGLVDEWELARAAFEQAIKLDEKNAEAWAWLGEANQQTAKGDALTYLDRALSLNPNSSVVHGLRGLYFQRAGNHREALVEFQSAAKLDPKNPDLYISIGDEFSMTGDLIRALEAYQYTTTLAPDDAKYWRLLAGFCARNNAHVRDVGIPAAQRAVKLAPKDPLALDMLGWLLVLDSRYYEAEKILNEALELNPQLSDAHFHLALLYLQTNKPDAMRDHLTQARDLGNEEAAALLKQYFP